MTVCSDWVLLPESQEHPPFVAVFGNFEVNDVVGEGKTAVSTCCCETLMLKKKYKSLTDYQLKTLDR